MLFKEEKDKIFKDMFSYIVRNFDLIDWEYTDKDLIYESIIDKGIVSKNTEEMREIFNKVIEKIDEIEELLED